MDTKLVVSRRQDDYNPPMPKEDEVRRTLRLPREIDRELAELAHEQRRSVNAAIVVAVERYLRQMNARRPRGRTDGV